MTWVSKMFGMGIPASRPIGGGRYEYIDILKGFTIIWVLWMHMNLPELIYPSVQMPIFFFISGTFYHAHKPTLWQQVKSDAYKLLLPSLVFSLFAFGYGCYKGTLDLHGFWHPLFGSCWPCSISARWPMVASRAAKPCGCCGWPCSSTCQVSIYTPTTTLG